MASNGIHDYRAYGLKPDNHIETYVNLACADDEEAWNRARDALKQHAGVELWQNTRLVKRRMHRRDWATSLVASGS
jgi:hypothetical protein